MDTQRPERPNLFKYGRKELSQDAMICWLLAWANECYAEPYPDHHKAGQSFVKALFRKHDRALGRREFAPSNWSSRRPA